MVSAYLVLEFWASSLIPCPRPDWNESQIASMEAWGNAKANAYWEARKPASMTVDST